MTRVQKLKLAIKKCRKEKKFHLADQFTCELKKIYKNRRKKYEKGKHGIGNILAEEYQVTPAVISEIINKKRNYGYY